MRPRLRSYGDSSTRTLSPGTTRMKFIRIFPEICARTAWPFWSSTLNIALGESLGDRSLHLDDVLVARLTAGHGPLTQKTPRQSATGSKNVPKPHDFGKHRSCGH